MAKQTLPRLAQPRHPNMPAARKAPARNMADLKPITQVQRETGAISPGMGQSLLSAAALARTPLGVMSMGVSGTGAKWPLIPAAGAQTHKHTQKNRDPTHEDRNAA